MKIIQRELAISCQITLERKTPLQGVELKNGHKAGRLTPVRKFTTGMKERGRGQGIKGFSSLGYELFTFQLATFVGRQFF